MVRGTDTIVQYHGAGEEFVVSGWVVGVSEVNEDGTYELKVSWEDDHTSWIRMTADDQPVNKTDFRIAA